MNPRRELNNQRLRLRVQRSLLAPAQCVAFPRRGGHLRSNARPSPFLDRLPDLAARTSSGLIAGRRTATATLGGAPILQLACSKVHKKDGDIFKKFDAEPKKGVASSTTVGSKKLLGTSAMAGLSRAVI
eukprot:6678344-Pyramimonas_sp.AAC.1